jgi:hypothetical protein
VTIASTSVSALAVMVLAIWSPTRIVRAALPSWARRIVRVDPTMAVTRTISALDGSGDTPKGQTVALNGGAGTRPACPAVTSRLVPLVAGFGAVATSEVAKFAWASGTPASLS